MESQTLIRVYELVPPETIIAEAKTIGKLVFGCDGDARTMRVADGSGWIYFADASQLDPEAGSETLLASGEDAQRLALGFLGAAGRALATQYSQSESKSDLSILIPPESWLTFESAFPVPNPSHTKIHHWLVRFGITVSTGLRSSKESIPVRDAGVDVHLRGRAGIGQFGNVLACSLRWRPFYRDKIVYQPMYPDLTDPAIAPDGTESEPARPWELVYLMHGQYTPQKKLCPYYAQRDEDEELMLSACESSLVVRILVIQSKGLGKLQAVVLGGSGEFSFQWGAWRVTAAQPGGEFLVLGGEAMAVLEPGVYNVILHVEDSKHGVVVQHEQMIFIQQTEEEPLDA